MIDTGVLAALDELSPLGDEAPAAAAERGEGAVFRNELRLTVDNPALRTKGILMRRDLPIVGYCGLNGQGKSMMAVRDTLLSLAMGRRVLSTVTILDAESGNPHPNFIPFKSWQQLNTDLRNSDGVWDEITGILDSRDGALPKHVRRMIPQMRRENHPVRWTGISWDNTDVRLRQLTWAMVRCVGHDPVPRQRTDGFADSITMWRPNRTFVATTFDARTLAKSDAAEMITEDRNKKRRAKVLNREFVRGPALRPVGMWPVRMHPGQLAFQSYNTLDAVLQIDNSCPICGGRIPEKTCRGHGAPNGPEFDSAAR